MLGTEQKRHNALNVVSALLKQSSLFSSVPQWGDKESPHTPIS